MSLEAAEWSFDSISVEAHLDNAGFMLRAEEWVDSNREECLSLNEDVKAGEAWEREYLEVGIAGSDD